jgi:hypothetical protein
LFFRDNSLTYIRWDGGGDTIATDPANFSNFVFTSDGYKVHLYASTLTGSPEYRGFITPSTTEMDLIRYGNGGTTSGANSYTGKMFYMGAWNTFSADGTFEIGDALFYHTLAEGFDSESTSITAYDISGNLFNGTLVPNTTVEVMRTTDDFAKPHNYNTGFSKYETAPITSIAKYYDDRQCAVIWKSDDMQVGPGQIRWDRYIDSIVFARANNMVYSPGMITSYTFPSSWPILQAQMDLGNVVPHNHSYSHPTTIESYDDQYVVSQTLLLDNLDFGWQYQYKGAQFLSAFYQWGGCGNLDSELVVPIMEENDYLINTTGRGKVGVPQSNNTYGTYGTFDYAPWDTKTGMFQDSGLGVGTGTIWDASYPAGYDFATTYNNGGVYLMGGHDFDDKEWVEGTEEVTLKAFYSDVGNRTDVWYTDPTALYTYRYLSTKGVPDITSVDSGSDIIISVDGSSLPRSRYGLSYPLTYQVAKPAYLQGLSAVNVYYRDTVDTGWVLMTEKTSAEFFTGINAFRDEIDTVYISQGLPQTSDTFELKVEVK